MRETLLTVDRLQECITGFRESRIAVVGDFFLDRYLDIDPALEEISVETGLPAHQISDIRCAPGAAGTVVANLAALGAAELHAVGFTGDDGESFELRRGLTRLGCITNQLHTTAERFTPTYTKPRNRDDPTLSGEHSRLDTKNRKATPSETERAIVESLTQLVHFVDAVIVADQVESSDCGAITAAVRQAIASLAAANPHVVFWADSRRRISLFQNVITKPNQFELVENHEPVVGETIDSSVLQDAAAVLRRQTAAPVFVTCGERGMWVTDPEWTEVPGVRVPSETDTTGAGDSATAGCVMSLCAGANFIESAVIGNLVASITIEQLATTGTARPDQLVPRFEQWVRQEQSH